jgi:autonomous glycyl radical cofactor GrcA
MTPLKQRGKNRRTHIYTKGEDQTDNYIYAIRLNNMTPLKQRGKIRRTYIYTKGEDLTNIYIY